MATVEERVAFVEGRIGEQGHMVDGIREAVQNLEARLDRRFEAIDRRFDAIDRRFEAVDRRFETIEYRLTALDQKLDRRVDGLDQKMSRHFMWLVGIQLTTLAAIIAALVAR